VSSVETGTTQADALGGAHEVKQGRIDPSKMTTINEEHRRIAYCECGAQLAGSTEEELFDAAQRHVAHHHPQLLGALEPDVVTQMAENVGGH